MILANIESSIVNKKIAVIIPSYNNCESLQTLINCVLKYTQQIIVVDNASTDGTSKILENYDYLESISLKQNIGKSNALKIGFEKAKSLGYNYAITMDSDGQHSPNDIPIFVENLLKEDKDILLIGCQNTPQKNGFKNNFSNFWFQFETGIKLEDTQSGYRLYPLKRIPKKIYTQNFEFETIVRAAWNGTLVKNTALSFSHNSKNQASQLEDFKSFVSLILLNIALSVIALIYIKPRNFIRAFKKKKFKDFIKEDILESAGSPTNKALSVALGTFIAFSPFWGFQTILTLSLAFFFRLNKVLAFTFSHLSLPPLIPFIIWISLLIGGLFIGGSIDFKAESLGLDLIKKHLLQYLIGSFTLASLMAIILGFSTFFILKTRNKN